LTGTVGGLTGTVGVFTGTGGGLTGIVGGLTGTGGGLTGIVGGLTGTGGGLTGTGGGVMGTVGSLTGTVGVVTEIAAITALASRGVAGARCADAASRPTAAPAPIDRAIVATIPVASLPPTVRSNCSPFQTFTYRTFIR
jgi:hypothetical protein